MGAGGLSNALPELVKDGGPMTDPEKRHTAFSDAQKLLTGDASAIFVYNQLHGFLYQPARLE